MLAQSAAEKTGVNSALGIAPKTQDFVTQAAQSDMLEIETSKLAQANGNASIKGFADQMVTDHTKTSAELKALVGDNKISATLPTALDKAHQDKLDKLKKLQGADFVKEYKSMQVSAQAADAVSLFERYGQGGGQSSAEGVGGQDAAGAAASPADGAGSGEEVVTGSPKPASGLPPEREYERLHPGAGGSPSQQERTRPTRPPPATMAVRRFPAARTRI